MASGEGREPSIELGSSKRKTNAVMDPIYITNIIEKK